jgi:hypothetical protein
VAIDDMMSGGSRGRRDGPSRSGARAAIFWVIALVAGLGAAVLLKWYMDRSAAPPAPPLARLVVAAVDLPVATTIRSEHIKEVEWPESARNPWAPSATCASWWAGWWWPRWSRASPSSARRSPPGTPDAG